MLIATTIIIWIIALALPSPKRYRRTRQTIRQATPEKLPTLPDPDEIAHLQYTREKLLEIAAEIDELPDSIAKTKKQIANDNAIFRIDKQLKRLYN